MRKSATPPRIPYKPGDIGGRGPNPKDANGLCSPTHNPLPNPWEVGSMWEMKVAIRRPEGPSEPHLPPPPVQPAPKVRITTTTGLISLEDFCNEAETLGISCAELTAKLTRWFARRAAGEVSEGMARMQCGQLLKHAQKKAGGV